MSDASRACIMGRLEFHSPKEISEDLTVPMRHRLLLLCIPFFPFSWSSCVAEAQTREEKVRADKEKVVADGFWIYNDLPGAMQQAKENGKPVLVVLRCIPCEECVKLDDDLVDKDPVIRPLLEKFVCVRQVSTNGLDLDTFQYDTDQSFAIFMLNPDGTIYGRFGTRSHRTDWFGDVSLKGLAKALQGALDLHANYPSNQQSLAGKRGQRLEFASPEKYPSLKNKFTESLNYEGDVVKSCIHCHQIGDARREYYWTAGKPIPEELMFPYPHPKSIGLILDPDEEATVAAIEPNSAAAQSGLRAGDVIKTFAGQPMLSIADVQWVLHRIKASGGGTTLEVVREGKPIELKLTLEEGWRRAGDITWRVSTWPLRRMVLGGMVLDQLSDEQREQLRSSRSSAALAVKRVGQYGAHAAAKKAGFREGDLLVEFDGRSDFASETDLLRYAIANRRAGDTVDVTVLRRGQSKKLKLPIQQ